MKYWGPIRIADLKNRSDAELGKLHSSCSKKAYAGVALMGAGVLTLASGFLSLLFPVIPVITVTVLGGGMILTGMRLQSKNFDGMLACTGERMIRMSSAPVPAAAPASAQEPAPAPAPVFNGVAATVLESDLKPMKAIKISAKAAPAAQ